MSLTGVRVALVTRCYPPIPGDLARAAHEQAHALASAGAEVIVLTTGLPIPDERVPPPGDGRVRVYRLASPYEAQALMALEQSLRPMDALHTITLGGAHAALQAFPHVALPVIVSIRERDGAELSAVVVPILQRAAWIIAESRAVLARARQFCDIDGRGSVIPPAIDAIRDPEWRATPDNHGVVGAIVDMSRPETVRWLIDVYRRLPRDLRRRLVLREEASDGIADTDDTLQLRCACGLSPEIALTLAADDGHRAGWFDGLRVFVLASIHDGALRALHEATAAGVPIVAATVDGVEDMLTDRVDALLVPPDDPARTAEAIRELLTDDGLAASLASRARRAAPRMTEAAARARYVEVYEDVLEARRRVASA